MRADRAADESLQKLNRQIEELRKELIKERAMRLEGESALASIVQEWEGRNLAREVNDARILIEGRGWQDCGKGHWEHPNDGPCSQCGEDQ